MSLSLKKVLLSTALAILVLGQFARVNTTVVEANNIAYLAKNEINLFEARTIENNINSPVYADVSNVEIANANSKIDNIYADPEKVRKVEAYLISRGSPLASKAKHIVKMASIYGVDYRLVPAISIIESSGCIHMYRSNNCWGWGGIHFASLEDGVTAVTVGMAKYYANGATSPYAMQRSYCPPCTTWGAKVTGVMSQIEAM